MKSSKLATFSQHHGDLNLRGMICTKESRKRAQSFNRRFIIVTNIIISYRLYTRFLCKIATYLLYLRATYIEDDTHKWGTKQMSITIMHKMEPIPFTVFTKTCFSFLGSFSSSSAPWKIWPNVPVKNKTTLIWKGDSDKILDTSLHELVSATDPGSFKYPNMWKCASALL